MKVLVSIIITGHTLHYTLHMDESWIFILSSHQMAPHFDTYFVTFSALGALGGYYSGVDLPLPCTTVHLPNI